MNTALINSGYITNYGYENEKRILYADWRESEGIHISPK